MNEYTIWFDQINASMYTVKAKDDEAARKKAKKEWKKKNNIPEIVDLVMIYQRHPR